MNVNNKNSYSYFLNNTILEWSKEEITDVHFDATPIARNPDADTYYSQFSNFIIEEARANLHRGLEKSAKKRPLSLSMQGRSFRQHEATSTIIFEVSINMKKPLRSGTAFLLNLKGNSDHIIGLSTGLDEKKRVEFRISSAVWSEKFASCKSGCNWEGRKLGSVVTLQRMDHTCVRLKNCQDELSLTPYLIGGKTPALHEEEEFSLQSPGALNPSQQSAIKSALKVKEGFHLIQGPPGTGKTTTVAHLIAELLNKGENKIFVCASSNKAVQEIAARFLELFPSAPSLLVGNEAKMAADSKLKGIFFDLWYSERAAPIKKLRESLEALVKNIRGNPSYEEKCKSDPESIKEMILLFTNIRNVHDEIVAQFKQDAEKYKFSNSLKIVQNGEKIRKSLEGYCNLSFALEAPSQEKITKCVASFSPHSINQILGSTLIELENAQNELIASSKVVFSTLSVSASPRLLEKIKTVDTLIVDEAGQSIESEILIPMIYNPQKCILIGDIKQLPATVISHRAARLDFGRSLMERLITHCSHSFTMLNNQYRMHPEISKWPAQQFYRDKDKSLENAPSVCGAGRIMEELEGHPQFLAPYSFINIKDKECLNPASKSFFNPTEAMATVKIIDYLAQRCKIDVAKRVSVITFYAEQVGRIAKLLSKYPNIQVKTVDGYQGGENDIVIISFVRSNFHKQIGFLKEFQRLNVAITRARFSLIMLGNEATMAKGDIAALVTDAKERKRFYEGECLKALEEQPDPTKKAVGHVSPKAVESKTQTAQKGKGSNGKTAKNSQRIVGNVPKRTRVTKLSGQQWQERKSNTPTGSTL
jgi:senataxin